MNIKICGITNIEDAQNAISLGVNAIGFIFVKDSPRYITPETAEEISMNLPPFIQSVGVFLDQSIEEINAITTQCRLDIIQLHGSESPGFCLKMPRKVIKAIKVSDIEDIIGIAKYQGIVSAILLDTKVMHRDGGTGKTFDWGLALKAKDFDIPIILAGGINITNLQKALTLVNPYAIDISTGVENSPGKKDYNKMEEVLHIAKNI
ncbi:MAG: phosphoribosylanthranilate isomerase [bacterium]|nr:phosphoribosylanthranilate isomerase [bacterium]